MESTLERETFHSEMDDFRLTPEYQDSSLFQRELFDTAMLRVQKIMYTYGLCFDTLLEYVAGVLCFPCQPHWHHQVLLSGEDRVLRLKISEFSNDALWTATHLETLLGSLTIACRTPFWLRS